MRLSKIALLGASSLMLAMAGCDGPRVSEDAGRDSGMVVLMDAGVDAGSDEDAGTDAGMTDDDAGADDAGTDGGTDAAMPDAGPPDGGPDSGPPDAGCVPDTCAPAECGVNVRDDGCGTLLDCGTCGVGGGCNDDTGCRAGFECLTEADTAWTDGYCTRECRRDADCTASSHCGFRDAVTLIGVCVRNCTSDTDCRAGYACRDEDGDPATALECVPDAIGTGAVGDPCTATSDCAGLERGICLVEPNGWHEGYCSMTCDPVNPCPVGSHCGNLDTAGRGICFQNCTGDLDCRADGYLCINGDGDGLPVNECYPAATGAGLPGAACEGTWECAGGDAAVCWDEDEDRLDGYCIRVGCGTGSPCPTGSHCGNFDLLLDGTAFPTCTPNCTMDTDCRPGYACFDANGDGTNECWQAGTGTTPIGGACEGIWDCPGRENALCAQGLGFRDGYCTILNCTATGAGACPAGSHCAALPAGGTATIPGCVDDCSATDPCRVPGYGCYNLDTDTTNECWSAATGAGQPGEACLWRSDCAGGENGICYLLGDPAVEGDEWQGGYCMQFCDAANPCPSGSVCWDVNGICVHSCGSDSDCRFEDAYACMGLGTGDLVCLP